MARKYHQGFFRPKNPQKYKGNINNIYYRSSWEFKVMQKLDEAKNILAWNSEEVVIPYVSPVDGKPHRYFVDFVFQKESKDGTKTIHLVEVKPHAQTKEPEQKNKKTKTFVSEVMTYGVNQAKWNAAKEYCQKRGWHFHVITEKHLKSMLSI